MIQIDINNLITADKQWSDDAKKLLDRDFLYTRSVFYFPETYLYQMISLHSHVDGIVEMIILTRNQFDNEKITQLLGKSYPPRIKDVKHHDLLRSRLGNSCLTTCYLSYYFVLDHQTDLCQLSSWLEGLLDKLQKLGSTDDNLMQLHEVRSKIKHQTKLIFNDYINRYPSDRWIKKSLPRILFDHLAAKSLEKYSRELSSALFRAVARNDPIELEMLLQSGYNPNFLYYDTKLIYLILSPVINETMLKQRLVIIDLLIEYGLNLATNKTINLSWFGYEKPEIGHGLMDIVLNTGFVLDSSDESNTSRYSLPLSHQLIKRFFSYQKNRHHSLFQMPNKYKHHCVGGFVNALQYDEKHNHPQSLTLGVDYSKLLPITEFTTSEKKKFYVSTRIINKAGEEGLTSVFSKVELNRLFEIFKGNIPEQTMSNQQLQDEFQTNLLAYKKNPVLIDIVYYDNQIYGFAISESFVKKHQNQSVILHYLRLSVRDAAIQNQCPRLMSIVTFRRGFSYQQQFPSFKVYTVYEAALKEGFYIGDVIKPYPQTTRIPQDILNLVKNVVYQKMTIVKCQERLYLKEKINFSECYVDQFNKTDQPIKYQDIIQCTWFNRYKKPNHSLVMIFENNSLNLFKFATSTDKRLNNTTIEEMTKKTPEIETISKIAAKL